MMQAESETAPRSHGLGCRPQLCLLTNGMPRKQQNWASIQSSCKQSCILRSGNSQKKRSSDHVAQGKPPSIAHSFKLAVEYFHVFPRG